MRQSSFSRAGSGCCQRSFRLLFFDRRISFEPLQRPDRGHADNLTCSSRQSGDSALAGAALAISFFPENQNGLAFQDRPSRLLRFR